MKDHMGVRTYLLWRGPDAPYEPGAKNSERDVVRVTEGQPRPVVGIDDAAIGDAEVVQPVLPCLEVTSVCTVNGEVVQADATFIEREVVDQVGKLMESDEGLSPDEPDRGVGTGQGCRPGPASCRTVARTTGCCG